MKQFNVNEVVQCYLDIFDFIKVIKSLILLCIIRLILFQYSLVAINYQLIYYDCQVRAGQILEKLNFFVT